MQELLISNFSKNKTQYFEVVTKTALFQKLQKTEDMQYKYCTKKPVHK